jgi:hypothetical protein
MKQTNKKPNPKKDGFKRPQPKKRYGAEAKERIEASEQAIKGLQEYIKKNPKAFADL